MSNLHKDTIVYDNGWFIKERIPLNIPQPCFLVIDRPYCLSNDLPNIFIQVEPNIIVNYENYLISNYHKYHTIYTFNKNVLENCPNSKKYLYGTTWLDKEYYNNIDISKKNYSISHLAGSKIINNSLGHILRQSIHYNQSLFQSFPITFFRSYRQLPHIQDFGNNPLLLSESKTDLFTNYQFSIIIENSKQIDYFTEKIIDCILSKTIPIYWGCPNISDYFDITGWIILETDSIYELQHKLHILNPPYYHNFTETIEKNYNIAQQYSDLYINLQNAV
jgi:hypothetical protein